MDPKNSLVFHISAEHGQHQQAVFKDTMHLLHLLSIQLMGYTYCIWPGVGVFDGKRERAYRVKVKAEDHLSRLDLQLRMSRLAIDFKQTHLLMCKHDESYLIDLAGGDYSVLGPEVQSYELPDGDHFHSVGTDTYYQCKGL